MNGYNNLFDNINDHFDDNGNGNDGYNSLRSFFFFIELDKDPVNIDLNLNPEPKRFYDRVLNDTVPVAEKSRTGNSAGESLIFSKFLLGKILRTANISIILNGDRSAVDSTNLTTLRSSEHELEPH
jgi:hypothetical protein